MRDAWAAAAQMRACRYSCMHHAVKWYGVMIIDGKHDESRKKWDSVLVVCSTILGGRHGR